MVHFHFFSAGVGGTKPGGTSTASMTCTTPLTAITSAVVTVASLILTILPSMVTVTSCLSRVIIFSLFFRSAANTLPAATWYSSTSTSLALLTANTSAVVTVAVLILTVLPSMVTVTFCFSRVMIFSSFFRSAASTLPLATWYSNTCTNLALLAESSRASSKPAGRAANAALLGAN